MEWVGSHYHVGRPKTEAHRKNIGKSQRGKKHTAKHNENIRLGVFAAHERDPSIAERSSIANTGKIVTDKTRASISSTRTRMIASGEIVINADKISDTITRKMVNGEFTWAKGTYVGEDRTKRVHFRSSWEFIRMCELDADKTVVSWQSEFTSIPYVLESKKHRYVPDFHVQYVDGRHALEEVKPFELRNTPMNVAKREAALQYCLANGWTYEEWPSVKA